ncbi:MAG: hypothetical protein AAB456_02070, partial [Patescibacteria group bacterium]
MSIKSSATKRGFIENINGAAKSFNPRARTGRGLQNSVFYPFYPCHNLIKQSHSHGLKLEARKIIFRRTIRLTIYFSIVSFLPILKNYRLKLPVCRIDVQ